MTAENDQIKLGTLSVFNWGSFQGLHTIGINGDGTLITGENGAGKSTIIDGLMALLRPANNAGFNMAAAQGDKSDRNIVSYMRGSYGRALNDEDGQISRNLRSGSVVSVIKAVYYHTQSDRKAVLMGIFYINGTGMAISDVKRIYTVGETDINIKDLLRNFTNNDTRSLKNYLKKFPDVRICDNNFSEYCTYFTHKLHMDNQNAPALLSRALGLKKIDDLTTLIRTLVLEPGEIRKDAEDAVKQFSDLRITHDRLSDARAQQECLHPLREFKSEWEKSLDKKDLLDEAQSSFPGYSAAIEAEDRARELEEEIHHQEKLSAAVSSLEEQKTEADRYVDICHENYLKNGGDSLEKFELEIRQKQGDLDRVRQKMTAYEVLAHAAGLVIPTNDNEFQTNLGKCRDLENEISRKDEAAVSKMGKLSWDMNNEEKSLATLKEEIADLEKHPDSNIPSNYQRLRDDISRELEIDRSRLVYVAELMEVRPEEESWHGAIERALGGIRQTLLVAKEDYRNITAWLNSRHTGLHVRVQVTSKTSANTEFGNRGFLRKLYWKDHEFTPWLKEFLTRYDLTCASSVEEMNETEFSMTREGLIHKKGGFFEKKDISRIDDRHDWFTGFSIKDRLAMLKEDAARVEKHLQSIKKKIDELRMERHNYENDKKLLVKLETYTSFSEIDTRSIETQIEVIKDAIEKIRASADTLKVKEIWETAKKDREELEKKLRQVSGELATVENSIKSLEERITQCRAQAVTDLSPKILAVIKQICRDAGVDGFQKPVYRDIYTAAINQRFKERQNNLAAEITTCQNRITAVFSRFATKWETISADWGTTNIAALTSYLNHLDGIEREGLPALVEEFREKLNNEVSQAVACISTKMESEVRDIENRIDKINGVLEKTEFRENTYLAIRTRKPHLLFVEEFRKNVNRVLSLFESSDHEKRYSAVETVIQTLESALSSKSLDSQRLLDPRLQVQFTAQELDRETREIRDVLDSSSGKSGGEKEAFAGTVVAASLAYVLTPENSDMPVYSTVFLDEAFSNTSDAVSIRVLKIFRELKLHVNLITPFKNIDIARDFARSLIIMSRDINTHSSCISELTWEEYDSEVAKARDEELRELGISVEEVAE